MRKIEFGTDGWRAVVGQDFNEDNVFKVAKSVGKYVYDKFGIDKEILVGYDPRNMAPEYAQMSAEFLASLGLNVALSSEIVATPILAFSAKHLSACAVMFTASHNPPEYLGIKFIPDYGGPATDDITSELVKNLDSDITSFGSPKDYKTVSFIDEYISDLESKIDFQKIKKSGISVNYDGHHGAASQTFKFILDKYKINNNSFNLDRDINFGGFMPDPKEKYLPELKKVCVQNGLIGLSNDGDGDRFGVFNEKGEFVSPNEIISILLFHLSKNKGYTGKLAKTVGASSMLDLTAQKSGIDVILTPVGFKWLGDAMRHNDVIIAGEESGGLSIKGHIPEKDGILANLLIIEAMAYSGKRLVDLQSELHSFLGHDFFSDRYDFSFSSKAEQEKIMNKFLGLETFGGHEIKKKITIDGIKYIFDNDSWILIRKSGTEPLLRVYFETFDKSNLAFLGNTIKKFVADY